jgi:flagellin-like protein
MFKKMRKYRRAVSPVIATVILVAVAITVAVAVAYWMGGIAGTFTEFEQVEIQSAVCVADGTNGCWNITMKLKNTGTATTTLIGCFLNEIEVDDYTGTFPPAANTTGTDMTDDLTIESGATAIINIYVDDGWGAPVTSGTTVNVKLHSAGGMDYIRLVGLV